MLASNVRGEPNVHLTETVECWELATRLGLLLQRPHGFVWLAGGSGSLVELVMAWHLAVTTKKPDRPHVLVGTSWQELLDMCASKLHLVAPSNIFQTVPDVAAAVALLDAQQPRA